MLKIFTDTSFITAENRSIIFPLLLDVYYIEDSNILKLYRLVNSIEEADIVIVPIQISYFLENNKTKWLYDFIDGALELNKKVWVYSAGDFGITLKKPVYTFRLGGFDSKLDEFTFIMPSFVSDPYKLLQKDFIPIEKSLLPKIGFVGHADGTLLKWLKELAVYLNHNFKRITKQIYADYQPFYPSSIKRFQFLSSFQKNNKIETQFVFRNKYRAGVKKIEDREKSTLDFLGNIESNPYTFCLRGAGNFSVRFYETLAMGRIPLVIDTDFRLPLNKIIQWKEHCIIVNEQNFIEKLIDFHSTISENDFRQMQINNRNLWLNTINRGGFFRLIHNAFKNSIK